MAKIKDLTALPQQNFTEEEALKLVGRWQREVGKICDVSEAVKAETLIGHMRMALRQQGLSRKLQNKAMELAVRSARQVGILADAAALEERIPLAEVYRRAGLLDQNLRYRSRLLRALDQEALDQLLTGYDKTRRLLWRQVLAYARRIIPARMNSGYGAGPPVLPKGRKQKGTQREVHFLEDEPGEFRIVDPLAPGVRVLVIGKPVHGGTRAEGLRLVKELVECLNLYRVVTTSGPTRGKAMTGTA